MVKLSKHSFLVKLFIRLKISLYGLLGGLKAICRMIGRDIRTRIPDREDRLMIASTLIVSIGAEIVSEALEVDKETAVKLLFGIPLRADVGEKQSRYDLVI